MTDLPIIMSAPMVLATLREVEKQGTGKTETRRLLYTKRKTRNGAVNAMLLNGHSPPAMSYLDPMNEHWTLSGWHKVKAGDRLWVRENFWALGRWEMTGQPMNPRYSFIRQSGDTGILYAADDPTIVGLRGKFAQAEWAWHLRPNIFLPREDSRLTLLVTATKIERLQAISETSATAEGADRNHAMKWPDGDPGTIHDTRRRNFCALWRSLHGGGAWDANPEVVAISFRPVLSNIDSMKEAAPSILTSSFRA